MDSVSVRHSLCWCPRIVFVRVLLALLDDQTLQIALVTGAERPEPCDKQALNIGKILSVTNVALTLCGVGDCQWRERSNSYEWPFIQPTIK